MQYNGWLLAQWKCTHLYVCLRLAYIYAEACSVSKCVSGGFCKIKPSLFSLVQTFLQELLYMYLCSHTCTSIGCPDGYEVGFDNRCYSFHQSPVSFAAARSSCLAANDSDLVIIDSPGELEFLLNKTQELNFTDNDSLWIGKCKCCGVLS